MVLHTFHCSSLLLIDLHRIFGVQCHLISVLLRYLRAQRGFILVFCIVGACRFKSLHGHTFCSNSNCKTRVLIKFLASLSDLDFYFLFLWQLCFMSVITEDSGRLFTQCWRHERHWLSENYKINLKIYMMSSGPHLNRTYQHIILSVSQTAQGTSHTA